MLSRGWVFLQALKYGREVVCFFLCLLMQLAAGTGAGRQLCGIY